MRIHRVATSIAATAAIALSAPVLAQTVRETKVSNDTSTKDGVITTKKTVTQTSKRKTQQPKKILGVKVGNKTAVSQTVRETSTSSNGDTSTKVKTSN